MIDDCPPGPGPSRDKWTLDCVSSGRFKASFSEVVSRFKDHEARIYVFSDALTVDGVRVNVTAEVQQKVADILGCRLLTPKIADLIWDQREVTVQPHPRQITSETSAMVDHSAKVDAELAKMTGDPSGKLVCTVGKHWLIDDALLLHQGMAENYGWHFEGPSFQGIHGEVTATAMKDPKGAAVRLIQGRGWAHNMHHVDYSQTCVLWSQTVLIDGSRASSDDLMDDPVFAHLVSHDGSASASSSAPTWTRRSRTWSTGSRCGPTWGSSAACRRSFPRTKTA